MNPNHKHHNRNNSQRSAQQGFTLIELIVVIVILGVLAATALPKFFDIGDDAKAASTKGFAGAAASAMSLNFGGCSIQNHAEVANKCVKVDNCEDAASLLQEPLPTGYSITAAALGTGNAGSNGVSATCTMNGPGAKTATFQGISAGNG